MKKLTAIAAAVLALCVVLTGCGQKKNDTVRPTATAQAGVQTTKAPEEPTPTPLLDTDKTIDEMESRWYDATHRQTEAEKMVEDYNNGQTILNDPGIASADTGQAMVM